MTQRWTAQQGARLMLLARGMPCWATQRQSSRQGVQGNRHKPGMQSAG